MSELTFRATVFRSRQRAPWTVAGGPDPVFDDVDRRIHHALLTDPLLLRGFRRKFPHRGHVDYDEMVRLLGYVWDCPHDGSASVTGYRCGGCGRTQAAALGAAGRTQLPE